MTMPTNLTDLPFDPVTLLSDLEECLTLIYASCEWNDDHDAMLDRFRVARGEEGMSDWRWWAKEAGDGLYANETATKEQAIAWAREEYGLDADIEIIEARSWIDEIKGGDSSEFADARNHVKLTGGASNDV